MKASEQKQRAQDFVARWLNHGDEKQETQLFWIDLLCNVFGVEQVTNVIEFEKRVTLSNTSYIDAYITDTKVLIEQKSINIDLRKAYKQSDGSLCTPYQQAKRYTNELPYSDKPRFIVVSNFKEFLIYDQEFPQQEPEHVLLENLPTEYNRLSFLVHLNEFHIKKQFDISVQAGELVGKIYDSILKEYKDPTNEASLKSLNILCVRLVFCFYAEDSGLFLQDQFCDYLERKEAKDIRRALIDLFDVLNTKYEERDPYLDDELASFPYVNGGLFASEDIEIPNFTDEVKTILVKDSGENFNWSNISPTIFGAIFESTLNPDTRRSGGMHYTSVENIHKVIDPLFLDDLTSELDAILAKIYRSDIKRDNQKTSKGLYEREKRELLDFQNKLASLTFLDPACGSGNFLTETYLSLRKLENKVLSSMKGSLGFFVEDIVKVKISQFYGIEINDFAVSVAKTALWIAEAQMLKETNSFLQQEIDFLPLKSYVNIVENNAIKMDWSSLADPSTLSYIIGNPPFVGRRYRTREQQEEIANLFNYKDIDYVACWYKKAADYIYGHKCKCAFVSTNSITQGEQVEPIWKELLEKNKLIINFAYKSFVWNSEARAKAHVYVVIIGFSYLNYKIPKIFYADGSVHLCKHINPYLEDDLNIYVPNRSKPVCDVIEMQNGNVPLDGDALKIEPEDLDKFGDFPYIKRLIGGSELLNNEKRYVLWLLNVEPSIIKSNKEVAARVELCRKKRLEMKDRATQKLAAYPTRFRDTNNPSSYLALPLISTKSLEYIPIAFFNGDFIPTNQVQTVPNAPLYYLGVLMSRVHMLWVQRITGRFGEGVRYSKGIVYNNFIWPDLNESQKLEITTTSSNILKAREKYPESSLGDMYKSAFMPEELRNAHKENDLAVLKAYGFVGLNDEQIIQELFKMYAKKTHQCVSEN